ncbi:hypothetical protein RFI_12359 [Reticulomyxa filosa]|uniref:Polynucleotide adenylyltransferase n=1 Tax=Reticulomyxa filosa TaxID=46433 RepID=X6NFX6_RETFI|nr:hypothetical protein RFI_12359 [Reticulomyxa filosa]|eukprot:ETO24798.1 hypothetical protein RFI_12359 [Reticulomyxa filosa]
MTKQSTFASWKFGPVEPVPIMICDLKFDDDSTGWGWKPDTNQYDFMPILTPVHPMTNCAHNVIQPTFQLLCDELSAGDRNIGEMAPQLAHGSFITTQQWKLLFSKKDFFMDQTACYIDIECFAFHAQYRRICACINSDDKNNKNKRKRYVESKIRVLVRRFHEELQLEFVPHTEWLESETSDHFFLYTNNMEAYKQMGYVQNVILEQTFNSWRNSDYAKCDCTSSVGVRGNIFRWSDLLDLLETIPSHALRATEEKKKHWFGYCDSNPNLLLMFQQNIPFNMTAGAMPTFLHFSLNHNFYIDPYVHDLMEKRKLATNQSDPHLQTSGATVPASPLLPFPQTPLVSTNASLSVGSAINGNVRRIGHKDVDDNDNTNSVYELSSSPSGPNFGFTSSTNDTIAGAVHVSPHDIDKNPNILYAQTPMATSKILPNNATADTNGAVLVKSNGVKTKYARSEQRDSSDSTLVDVVNNHGDFVYPFGNGHADHCHDSCRFVSLFSLF